MKLHVFAVVSTLLLAGCKSNQQAYLDLPDNSLLNEEYRYAVPIATSPNAPLVSLNAQSGKLEYRRYANHGQLGKVNIVPDFSYAGYKQAEAPLPSYESLKIKISLSPTGNDRKQIQDAINSLAKQPLDAQGHRGVILLKKGHYYIDKPITVNASGIVLRGEGQDKEGTVLHATSSRHKDHFLQVKGNGGGNNFTPANNPHRQRISQPFVPVGTHALTLESTHGYRVGDTIAVVRTPNQRWVDTLDMADYGWKPNKYRIGYERKVIGINGNQLILDIPFVDSIDSTFGGGEVYRVDLSDRLQEVGIENMRLITRTDVWSEGNEDRAFYAIDFSEVENSWIRDVTVEAFSHGFNFRKGSRFNTAQDVSYVEPDFVIEGGRRYAFNFDDGSLNLFHRCHASDARHTFVVGSRAKGPNVFLDCAAKSTFNDSGPHHRWSTGILYDNTSGGPLRVQNRQNSGSGHGWAGAQQMFWNTNHSDYVLQVPYGAMSWAVGNQGEWGSPKFTDNEATGMIEAHNTDKPNPLLPRSLYLQQLEDRLGINAVMPITASHNQ